MKTTGNTILITGGSAGIGFELAKLLSRNNKVIITGRNKERLENAAAELENTTAVAADVTSNVDVAALVQKLELEFPELNMVVNNAGHAVLLDLADEQADVFTHAEAEMLTNYLSIIRLNSLLLPLLKKQEESAIVNVSSVVAFVPGLIPTYSASKAALHSYTQSLRFALRKSSVKVYELMPPLVNTTFSSAIGGERGIPPAQVAQAFTESWAKDQYEIRVGDTEAVYRAYLASPEEAFKLMNRE